MREKKGSYQFLVEAALTIALAMVFSKLVLFRLPQGGSVTLEIVPLLILSRRWGLKRGVIAGAVAGVLQWILGGYVIHPLQGLLDYPLAFAAMGLGALGSRKVWPGILLAVVVRIICHVASGVIFFASYAPEGTSALTYSIVYNGSFMLANLIIALILVPLILKRLDRLH